MSDVMKLEMNAGDVSFLQLAAKVAGGKADPKDKMELAALLKKLPELREEFREVEVEIEQENQEKFWDLALRVLFQTATPEEVKQLQSLKHDHPRQWMEYQDALGFLKAMASCPTSMKDVKLEPMPEDVQAEMLKSLKEYRERRPRAREPRL
jgi:hypothetical protein